MASMRDTLIYSLVCLFLFLYAYLEVTTQVGFLLAIALGSYFVSHGGLTRAMTASTVALHLVSRFVWETPVLAFVTFLFLDLLLLFPPPLLLQKDAEPVIEIEEREEPAGKTNTSEGSPADAAKTLSSGQDETSQSHTQDSQGKPSKRESERESEDESSVSSPRVHSSAQKKQRDWAILEAAREAARSEQMERAQLVVSRLQIVEY